MKGISTVPKPLPFYVCSSRCVQMGCHNFCILTVNVLIMERPQKVTLKLKKKIGLRSYWYMSHLYYTDNELFPPVLGHKAQHTKHDETHSQINQESVALT